MRSTDSTRRASSPSTGPTTSSTSTRRPSTWRSCSASASRRRAPEGHMGASPCAGTRLSCVRTSTTGCRTTCPSTSTPRGLRSRTSSGAPSASLHPPGQVPCGRTPLPCGRTRRRVRTHTQQRTKRPVPAEAASPPLRIAPRPCSLAATGARPARLTRRMSPTGPTRECSDETPWQLTDASESIDKCKPCSRPAGRRSLASRNCLRIVCASGRIPASQRLQVDDRSLGRSPVYSTK
mmetsp:Transcript_6548/g.19418  ORF Transcript_6548/g.19418 Transcript_6548/m.19418 type:complete len:236 (+) Transcript_6548:969-1676(+)